LCLQRAMALDGGGAAALQLGAYVLDVLVCIYSIRLASSSNIFSIEALRAMSFLVLQHLHGGFGVGFLATQVDRHLQFLQSSKKGQCSGNQ
jgi:hypothetical protein